MCQMLFLLRVRPFLFDGHGLLSSDVEGEAHEVSLHDRYVQELSMKCEVQRTSAIH